MGDAQRQLLALGTDLIVEVVLRDPAHLLGLLNRVHRVGERRIGLIQLDGVGADIVLGCLAFDAVTHGGKRGGQLLKAGLLLGGRRLRRVQLHQRLKRGDLRADVLDAFKGDLEVAEILHRKIRILTGLRFRQHVAAEKVVQALQILCGLRALQQLLRLLVRDAETGAEAGGEDLVLLAEGAVVKCRLNLPLIDAALQELRELQRLYLVRDDAVETGDVRVGRGARA